MKRASNFLHTVDVCLFGKEKKDTNLFGVHLQAYIIAAPRLTKSGFNFGFFASTEVSMKFYDFG